MQNLKTERYKMTENKLQKRETASEQGSTMDMLIKQAVDKGIPVESLEKLLAMRTQLKEEAAREAFFEDLAAFQSECPVIVKKTPGGKTNSGQVAYYYATLDSIVEQVKDLLKKYGFSYTIQSETRDGHVKATCVVHHTLGHTETSQFESPFATKTGVMSNPQVTASTLTFAKRYAFCNAFGIITAEEDKEDKLQEEEFKAGAMSEYGKRLMDSKTLEELKKAWVELPALAKKELTKLKEDVKKALTEETK